MEKHIYCKTDLPPFQDGKTFILHLNGEVGTSLTITINQPDTQELHTLVVYADMPAYSKNGKPYLDELGRQTFVNAVIDRRNDLEVTYCLEADFEWVAKN